MEALERLKKALICAANYDFFDALDQNSLGNQILKCENINEINSLESEIDDFPKILSTAYWNLYEDKDPIAKDARKLFLSEEDRMEAIIQEGRIGDLYELYKNEVISLDKLNKLRPITETLLKFCKNQDNVSLANTLRILMDNNIPLNFSKQSLITIASRLNLDLLMKLQTYGVNCVQFAVDILYARINGNYDASVTRYLCDHIYQQEEQLYDFFIFAILRGKCNYLHVLSWYPIKLSPQAFNQVCTKLVDKNLSEKQWIDTLLANQGIVGKLEPNPLLGYDLLIGGFPETARRFLSVKNGDFSSSIKYLRRAADNFGYGLDKSEAQRLRKHLWQLLQSFTDQEIIDAYSNELGTIRVADWFLDWKYTCTQRGELFKTVLTRLPFDFVYQQRADLDTGKILKHAEFSNTALEWLNSEYAEEDEELNIELGKLAMGVCPDNHNEWNQMDQDPPF